MIPNCPKCVRILHVTDRKVADAAYADRRLTVTYADGGVLIDIRPDHRKVAAEPIPGALPIEPGKLDDYHMSEYYPEWYERYETAAKDTQDYLTFEGENAGLFVWVTADNGNGITDPDGIQEMSPEEVLAVLFP